MSKSGRRSSYLERREKAGRALIGTVKQVQNCLACRVRWIGRFRSDARFGAKGTTTLRSQTRLPIAPNSTCRSCWSYVGLGRRHSLRKQPSAYLIALRTRFPTMPSSRTALLMIAARVGRMHRSRPFCRTGSMPSVRTLSKRGASGTGESSIVVVRS